MIMVIGANPTDAHPVFASRMKKRLREGAKLIVIDPRRIDLVRMPHVEASYHLPLRPGTNVAMLNALAHVIVTEGLVDAVVCRASVATPRRSPIGPRSSPNRATARKRLEADHRRAGRPGTRRGAAVRDRRQRRDLLRSRRDRAQPGQHRRHGDRQSGDGDRQYRPARRRREPAARPEQRPGILRHGQLPARTAWLSACRQPGVRAIYEAEWGVSIDPEPGLRIPNMFDAAVEGTFRGLYVQGEDIVQSDPDTKHVTAGLAAMECVVVHDLFLNETANYAHVFLPGATFLEKDGTFINAERRINRVRKVMEPRAGLGDWEVTQAISNAMGYPMHYNHPSEIMDEDRSDHADLRRRLLCEAGTRIGAVAVQRGRARRHADHAHRSFRARQGPFRRYRISCRPMRRSDRDSRCC